MGALATKLPPTLKERLEMNEPVVRYPAPPEEFFEMLAECEYKVEYHNGEIISSTDYASDAHQRIVANICRVAGNLLNDKDYIGYGSNRPIHVPGYPSCYNAYNMYVQDRSVLIPLQGVMDAVANPALIFELLSDSTRGFDTGPKFRNYRKIPSLRQVIFLETTQVLATVHTRTGQPNQWLTTDFENPDNLVPILGEGVVRLSDFYKNVALPPA